MQCRMNYTVPKQVRSSLIIWSLVFFWYIFFVRISLVKLLKLQIFSLGACYICLEFVALFRVLKLQVERYKTPKMKMC